MVPAVAAAFLGACMGLAGAAAAKFECPEEEVRAPLWAVAAAGAVLVGLLWAASPGRSPGALVLTSLAAAVGAADAHRRVVPNLISASGFLAGTALWAVEGRPLAALGGAAAASLPLLPGLLSSRMGAGDLKGAAALGAVAGWPLALRGLAFGALLGGAAALLRLASSLAQRKPWSGEAIPYAVFLAAGFALAVLP